MGCKRVPELVKSLNTACGDHGIAEPRLHQIFEVFWPLLKEQLEELSPQEGSLAQAEVVARSESDLLEELLELVRSQHRLLSTPSELLPPQYLREFIEPGGFSRSRSRSSMDHILRDLGEYYSDAIRRASTDGPAHRVLAALLEGLDRFEGPLFALLDEDGRLPKARARGINFDPGLPGVVDTIKTKRTPP